MSIPCCLALMSLYSQRDVEYVLWLQRILKVEYEFPAHVKVSKECRDLLSNILVPDPASRITIPEIQRHPWYLKDLPPGVAEMNDNLPVPTSGMQVGPPFS